MAINDLFAKFNGLFPHLHFLTSLFASKITLFFLTVLCQAYVVSHCEHFPICPSFNFASNSFFQLQLRTFPKAPSIILRKYLLKKPIWTTHSPIQKLSQVVIFLFYKDISEKIASCHSQFQVFSLSFPNQGPLFFSSSLLLPRSILKHFPLNHPPMKF